MTEINRVSLETVAEDRISEDVKQLAERFKTSEGILVPVGKIKNQETGVTRDKIPLVAWTQKDEKGKSNGLNTNIDWVKFAKNVNLTRASLAFDKNTELNFIVLDVDVTDFRSLALVEDILTEFNGKIIAYPSRKGAHLWFKIPEGFELGSWWTKRHPGYVTKTGVGPIDYLPNGIINVSLLSAKTGKVELMQNRDNFNPGELSPDMVNLFNKTGFQSLDISIDNIKVLPEVPEIAYPLRKPKDGETFDDLVWNAGAGKNTDWYTAFAGHLMTRTELGNDIQYEMEVCLDWMNDNFGEGQNYFEDMDAVISQASTWENETIYEPYKLDGKVQKEKIRKEKERVQKERVEKASNTANTFTQSGKELDTSRLIDMALNDNLGYMEWLLDSLEWRLLKDSLVLKHNSGRYISNSETIVERIMTTRGIGNYDLEKSAKIYNMLKSRIKTLIDIEYQTQYIINYNTKPLWIDRFGNQINPKDAFGEDNRLKIISPTNGIENGIIMNRLNIDFRNLKVNQEIEADFKEFILNAVEGNEEGYNYFLRMLGYMSMQGTKFLKKVLWIYSENASTGKSAMTDFFKNIFMPNDTVPVNLSAFLKEKGLAPLANKALATLDDVGNNFDKAEDKLKTIASEMEVLVDAKYKTEFEAIMPKLIMSMNEMPEFRADDGMATRIGMVNWSGKLNQEKYDMDMKNRLMSDEGRDTLFWMILKQFFKVEDMSAKSDFWNSPYQDMIDVHIDDNMDHDGQMYVESLKRLYNYQSRFDLMTIGQVKNDLALTEMSWQYDKIINIKGKKFRETIESLGYSYQQKTVDGKSQKRFVRKEVDNV